MELHVTNNPETPESLVQKLINDQKSRSLLQNFISDTVTPEVSARILSHFEGFLTYASRIKQLSKKT